MKSELLIEGIASQMRRADAVGALPWWHLISEEERERYRDKARNHISQAGWGGDVCAALNREAGGDEGLDLPVVIYHGGRAIALWR